MTKLSFTLPVPEDLYCIIRDKSKFQKDSVSPEPDLDLRDHNKSSYLLAFDKLIDPVWICMFYGLYKSKKLPHKVETSDWKEWEFNVSISLKKEIFNHFLFCIWIKENGFPERSRDINIYRRDLYEFLSNILNDDDFVREVMPFYILKASEASSGIRSFVSRLYESGFREYKMDQSSPEYLAQEFAVAEKDFYREIITPIEKQLEITGTSTLKIRGEELESEDIKELIRKVNKGETEGIEFKETLRINLKTGQKDQKIEFASLKTIAGFINSNGGALFIGVRDNKRPVGIGQDKFSDEDKMGLHLTNLIRDKLGPQHSLFIHQNFISLNDKRILYIKCDLGKNPVFVKEGKQERFFIRSGPATIELRGEKMHTYIKTRFGG